MIRLTTFWSIRQNQIQLGDKVLYTFHAATDKLLEVKKVTGQGGNNTIQEHIDTSQAADTSSEVSGLITATDSESFMACNSHILSYDENVTSNLATTVLSDSNPPLSDSCSDNKLDETIDDNEENDDDEGEEELLEEANDNISNDQFNQEMDHNCNNSSNYHDQNDNDSKFIISKMDQNCAHGVNPIAPHVTTELSNETTISTGATAAAPVVDTASNIQPHLAQRLISNLSAISHKSSTGPNTTSGSAFDSSDSGHSSKRVVYRQNKPRTNSISHRRNKRRYRRKRSEPVSTVQTAKPQMTLACEIMRTETEADIRWQVIQPFS